MKFPAIDEQMLSSDDPVLKDNGNIIDFYGPGVSIRVPARLP